MAIAELVEWGRILTTQDANEGLDLSGYADPAECLDEEWRQAELAKMRDIIRVDHYLSDDDLLALGICSRWSFLHLMLGKAVLDGDLTGSEALEHVFRMAQLATSGNPFMHALDVN